MLKKLVNILSSKDPSKFWTQFRSGYKATAIIFLNLCLVGGILTFGSNYFLTEDTFRYSSRLNPQAYYFVTDEDRVGIFREFDDWQQRGHWQIEPWTGLVSRQFNGKYLTVESRGRRRTTPPSPNHIDKLPFRVWAFGGSTMFGWGVADQHTPASWVQQFLQAHMPERQVQVTNFGAAYYNTSHEFSLFAANLRNAPQPPHVAVFLDGLNDVVHNVDWGNENPMMKPLTNAWENHVFRMVHKPWFTLHDHFPLRRLARQIRNSLPEHQDVLKDSREQSQEELQRIDERVALAAQRYQFNLSAIEAVGRIKDVVTVFCLQPVPMWMDPKNDSRILDPEYLSFRNQVMTHAKVHNIYDITGILAGFGKITTVDSTHYSDAAAEVVGQAMAKAIVEACRNDSFLRMNRLKGAKGQGTSKEILTGYKER